MPLAQSIILYIDLFYFDQLLIVPSIPPMMEQQMLKAEE
jgi:hypothetical protein